jgi:hypothetical protein
MSFEEAGRIPVVGKTAWQAIVTVGRSCDREVSRGAERACRSPIVHIIIERQVPLTDAPMAWEMNRRGRTGGKIILEVSH